MLRTCFGANGLVWLADQELPLAEQESVDLALRQVEFLDSEIAQVEQLTATGVNWQGVYEVKTAYAEKHADAPRGKRRLTIPAVHLDLAANW